MGVLGIDPGVNLGWAYRGQTGGYCSGVYVLKTSRFEGGGMRFLRLRHFLDEMKTNLEASDPIEAVVFEKVKQRHKSTDAAHCYGGIVAILTEWCESNEIPYLGIPVGTIKKTATGKGTANKEAMVSAAEIRWPGYSFITDDEADARWIVESYLEEIGK